MAAKPSPLYSTLSLALMDFIKTKGEAHEKMLSEREITKVYNVSRHLGIFINAMAKERSSQISGKNVKTY